MKKHILVIITISILFSCSSENENKTQIIDMRINHYQSTGLLLGPVMTLMVQEGNTIGTNNWNTFYNNIDGFNYIPGKIYNLSVKVEKVNNPPADGSSLQYTLLEVKSIEEVDNETLFDINLKMTGQSFIITNSGYKILNQIDIDCNSLCDELDTALQNKSNVIGTFKRHPNNEIVLVELQ